MKRMFRTAFAFVVTAVLLASSVMPTAFAAQANPATIQLSMVDQNGAAISSVDAGTTCYAQVAISNYGDYIYEDDAYPSQLGAASLFFTVTNGQAAKGAVTPYAGATVEYTAATGNYMLVSDGISKTQLDENQGVLFRVPITVPVEAQSSVLSVSIDPDKNNSISNQNSVSLTSSFDFQATASVNVAAAPLKKFSILENRDNFKITGRHVERDGYISFDNSSTMLAFNFNGKGAVTADVSVNIIEGDTAYLVVYIDGVRQSERVAVAGTANEWVDSTVTIASNLTAGSHEIRIYRSNEAGQALMNLKAISIDGTFEAKPADKDLYIEFLGDSITAGYGSMVNSGEGGGDAASSDGTLTYAFKAAERLDADIQEMDRSGMTFSEGSIFETDTSFGVLNSIDDYLGLICPFRNKTDAYDAAAARQPDAFVINLGTNDGGQCKNALVKGGYDDATFSRRATELVQKVRAMYPNTAIIWYYGMMGGDMTALIQKGVEDANDPNAYFISARLSNYSGGGGHPNRKAHAENGRYLANRIKAILDGAAAEPDPYAKAKKYPLTADGAWNIMQPAQVVDSANNDGTVHFYQDGGGWFPNMTDMAELPDMDLSNGFKFTASAFHGAYNMTDNAFQVTIGDYVIYCDTYVSKPVVTVTKAGASVGQSEPMHLETTRGQFASRGYGLTSPLLDTNIALTYTVTMDRLGNLKITAANSGVPDDIYAVYSAKVDPASFANTTTTVSWKKTWQVAEIFGVEMSVLDKRTEIYFHADSENPAYGSVTVQRGNEMLDLATDKVYRDDDLTLTATPAEGYKFVAWVNNTDLQVSTEPTITVVATNTSNYYRAVFETVEQVTDRVTVTVNINDRIYTYTPQANVLSINISDVYTGAIKTVIDSYTNYEFTYTWEVVDPGDNQFKVGDILDEVNGAITGNISVKPVFHYLVEYYHINVNGSDWKAEGFRYNEKVTVTATGATYWEDVTDPDDKYIISYENEYSFFAYRDRSLTSHSEAITPVPTVHVTQMMDEARGVLSFMAERTVPGNPKIQKAGIILGKGKYTVDELTLETVNYDTIKMGVSRDTNGNGQYVAKVKYQGTDVYTARAFIILTDGTVIYSDAARNSTNEADIDHGIDEGDIFF